MNGNNPIENKLNELFAKAKQQEPLITNEEVHTLISHAPTSAFPGKQLVNFINNHLKIIIMSTIVSSILIGFILFILQDPNKETLLNQNLPQMKFEKAKSIELKEDLKIFIPSNVKKDNSSKQANVSNMLNTSDLILNPVSKTIVFETGSTTNQIVHDTSCIAPIDSGNTNQVLFNGDEYILSLTINELCKLGFTLKDTIFYSYNIDPEDKISSGVIHWDYKPGTKVLTNSRPRPIIGYSGRNARMGGQATRNDYYPVYITNRFNTYHIYSTAEYKVDINNKYVNYTNQPFPSEKFELYNDELIPVVIVSDIIDNALPDSGFRSRIIDQFDNSILWFKNSESFYNLLPQRYRNKTKLFYDRIKCLKQQALYSNRDLVNYPSINIIKNAIGSIPKLELSGYELKRLGIFIENNKLQYNNKIDSTHFLFIHTDGKNISYSETNKLSVKKRPPQLKAREEWINSLPDDCEHYGFLPQFVSYSDGMRTIGLGMDIDYINLKKRRSIMSKSFDLLFLNNINRLIPILISKESVPNALEKDIIFWFSPNETFFDSLPARYRNDLKNEYKALLIQSNPDIPQEIKDKTPTVCTYFEECRPTYPELSKLKVYPNPAKDIVNIDFELNKPDKVRIVIFDIEGKPMRMLKDMEELPSGFNHLQVNMNDVPSGIYILTIQNNNGSYKTQRIIKQ